MGGRTASTEAATITWDFLAAWWEERAMHPCMLRLTRTAAPCLVTKKQYSVTSTAPMSLPSALLTRALSQCRRDPRGRVALAQGAGRVWHNGADDAGSVGLGLTR